MKLYTSKVHYGLLLLLPLSWGCSGEPAVETPIAPPPKDVTTPNPTTDPTPTPDPIPEPTPTPVVEKPPEPSMPKVVLSEEHLATCLVKVGDALPALTLKNAAGEEQEWKALQGEKATVVLFWADSNLYAPTALEDLQRDFVAPYAERGVKVVGVNVSGKPEDVLQAAQDAKATFPQLVDADGAAFAQVATKKLPRVYLLDAEGKILWFDISYDPLRTPRILQEALDFHLGPAPSTAP